MAPHVILCGTAPDDLLAWLPVCIQRAQQELSLHPGRPQPAAMVPHLVPLQQLYFFARELGTWFLGIYEALPDDDPPFGSPLLLLYGGLRDYAAGTNEVALRIWRHPRFPLELAEVAWLLESRFPSRPAPDSPLALYGRPADLASLCGAPPGNRQPPAPPAAERPAEAAAELRGEPSPAAGHRPPLLPAGPRRDSTLPSTLWLTEQIAALPEPVDPEPLYQDWARRYEACVGLIPRDSARSFNRALDTAFKHLGVARRRRRH
jgi:hypothetical protein